MRVLLGIQARSQSTRLPEKIFEKIGDKSILKWVYEAAEMAAHQLRTDGDSAEVYVLGPKDDMRLREYCLANKLQGLFPDCAENNLIDRYLQASEEFTHIARITADCWCIHPEIIVEACKLLQNERVHYAGNTIIRTFQEGQDIQVFSIKALQWLKAEAKTDKEFEHPWCEFDSNERDRNKFKKECGEVSQLVNPDAECMVKTSIDTKSDLEHARKNYDKWLRNQNAAKLFKGKK